MCKYFSITSFAILIWTFVMLFFAFENFDQIAHPYKWIWSIVKPFTIIFIVDFMSRKIQNKNFLILFKIIRFLIILYLLLNMIVITAFSNWTQKVPLRNYSKTVKELRKEDYFAVRHFPEKIPKGAKNYYCLMKEIDLYSVRFNIDEKYLEEVINKYRDEIQIEFLYSEHSKYKYDLPFPISIEKYLKNYEWEKCNQEEKEYTVYILKNKEEYTSGFVISKKYKEIIYFFYFNS